MDVNESLHVSSNQIILKFQNKKVYLDIDAAYNWFLIFASHIQNVTLIHTKLKLTSKEHIHHIFFQQQRRQPTKKNKKKQFPIYSPSHHQKQSPNSNQ